MRRIGEQERTASETNQSQYCINNASEGELVNKNEQHLKLQLQAVERLSKLKISVIN